MFRKIFEKPIIYILYATTAHNYSRQGYNPSTDRLIQATLSIASNSANGLIVWHDINNPAIQGYLMNQYDKQCLSEISKVSESQVREKQMMNIANSKNY